MGSTEWLAKTEKNEKKKVCMKNAAMLWTTLLNTLHAWLTGEKYTFYAGQHKAVSSSYDSYKFHINSHQ